MTTSPQPNGDSNDLAWLERRAEETRRHLHELQAQAQRQLDSGDATGAITTLGEVRQAQTVAHASKTALDDAYAAQAILLPPPPPTFTSEEEKAVWIKSMRGEVWSGFVEYDAAMSALRELPEPPKEDGVSSAEFLRLLDEHWPIEEQRVDLILKMEAAHKRKTDAAAALEALGVELVAPLDDDETPLPGI